MKTIIETRRLFLREFNLEDAEKMWKLNNDPDVLRYTGDPPFTSISHAYDFLKNYKDYKTNGFGRWAVILKETNEFIGWCGLKLNEENMVDIGFRFFKEQWNKGFATESAKACLKYGFNNLDLEEIIGRVNPENTASVKVLQKLDMHFWKTGYCDGIANADYYRLANI